MEDDASHNKMIAILCRAITKSHTPLIIIQKSLAHLGALFSEIAAHSVPIDRDERREHLHTYTRLR